MTEEKEERSRLKENWCVSGDSTEPSLGVCCWWCQCESQKCWWIREEKSSRAPQSVCVCTCTCIESTVPKSYEWTWYHIGGGIHASCLLFHHSQLFFLLSELMKPVGFSYWCEIKLNCFWRIFGVLVCCCSSLTLDHSLWRVHPRLLVCQQDHTKTTECIFTKGWAKKENPFNVGADPDKGPEVKVG